MDLWSLAHLHPAPAGASTTLGRIVQWFAGGDTPYMDLWHCMSGDVVWIVATIALALSVAAGYVVIAKHWWQNQKTLPDSPAKRALATMRNIFLYCGLCGYVFIPIKMFWPGWRLFDFFLLVLAYYTWRYAWNTKNLKVVYAELGRSTRLQADLDASRAESKRKSFFLNAIGHDLRTPLNGTMLHAELALVAAESHDHVSLRKAIEQIKDSTRTSAVMIDSLLEYARIDSGADVVQATSFRVDDLLAEVVEHHTPVAQSRGLYLKLRADRVTVTTDRLKLERIINNLVSNAIKFTPSGGVRVETQTGGPGLEIHVIDTGVGVDPAHRDRLFDEFFQVHNPARDHAKGFGLGLAIAKRLAVQLGGDIEMASALGGGSRFTVSLPVVAAPRATQTSRSDQDDVAVVRQ
jgi:signal transduction histidine kinase